MPFEWALLIALSLLWGGSFFFVEVTLSALSPTMVATLRVTIAAILLLAIIGALGIRIPTDGRSWRDFVMMGIINNVIPFNLIVWGQSYITGGLASILNATAPLFTVLIAHFITANERMTVIRVVGILVGFGGVVVTIGPSAIAGSTNQVLAQFALLGAACAYAFSVVFALRFSRRGISPIATASGQMIAASVMMLPILLIVDWPLSPSLPSVEIMAAVLGLAGLSTVLAYLIYYRLLATAGSVNLILVTFLIPVSAILLGALFLGEGLVVHQLFGMAIIGLGLAVIDGRLLKRLTHTPSH